MRQTATTVLANTTWTYPFEYKEELIRREQYFAEELFLAKLFDPNENAYHITIQGDLTLIRDALQKGIFSDQKTKTKDTE